MPVFDHEEQRVVVRIVYDGPAHAGKTTNLAQLSRFFTARRRSPLVTPGERAGRTLFFDWMQLEGGLVGGYPLRCQLVTVPGQGVLAQRRRFLLGRADAVVFVCESTPAGLYIAHRMLSGLRSHLDPGGAGPVAVVVQANKQDLPDRLEPAAVARHLELGEDTPIVAAAAEEGAGVRETLVLAIRAAADRAQRQLLELGAGGLAGTPESSDELLRAMLADEERDTREAPPTSAVDAVLIALPPLPASPQTSEEEHEPPLPTAQLPTGWVWPAASGREVLRTLSTADLAWTRRPDSGEGTYVVEGGGWILTTSTGHRYGSVDEARSAMIELARARLLLGKLLQPRAVLCLTEDRRGGFWVWSVRPRSTSLGSWLGRARGAGDEAFLAVALTAYGGALAAALRLAESQRLFLRLEPECYGIAEGGVVYLADDYAPAASSADIAAALLAPARDYSLWEQGLAEFAEALAEAFPIGAETTVPHHLLAALEAVEITGATERALRDRLFAHWTTAPLVQEAE